MYHLAKTHNEKPNEQNFCVCNSYG